MAKVTSPTTRKQAWYSLPSFAMNFSDPPGTAEMPTNGCGYVRVNESIVFPFAES